MAKPSNYWDRRAIKRLSEAEKQSEEYIKRINKMYDQAQRNIQRDIENIYRNYSKATGLDTQSLKALLTKSQSAKLWEDMKRKGLDKYVKGNYKARITRLEQLQAQIYAKAKQVYTQEQKAHTELYKRIVGDSYYKNIYDAQMGTGYDFGFSQLDENMVNALLNEKWSGKNYSQRIWGNTDLLAESLSEIVGGAMLSGQSIEKTSRQIRERFDVSKYYADRLVRTETNHFNNEADAMAYEEMNVDKYVFLATLDTSTSTKCQEMDNAVIPLKEREIGKNFPPLHPNCRSKTRAYMGEEIEKTLKRRAGDPITGKTKVIDNISYKEWAKKNGLTNSVKSSKINERSKGNVARITDTAISKVPKIKINGYTDEQSSFIQEQHKALLTHARDKNNGNEVAFVFRKGLTDKTIVVGTDKNVDLTQILIGKGDGLFVMHNHPRNGSISYDDILEFFTCDEISTISIVKNNGSVEVANKLPKFDKKEAMLAITRSAKKHVKNGTDAEYNEAVKRTLKKLQGEGFLQWAT